MRLDRLLPSVQTCGSTRAAVLRMLLAILFGGVGFWAGLGYAHMCTAGSRWIEVGAMLGAPLAAVVGVLFARRLWLGCLAAGLLILGVYALQQPYLEWAHRGMRMW